MAIQSTCDDAKTWDMVLVKLHHLTDPEPSTSDVLVQLFLCIGHCFVCSCWDERFCPPADCACVDAVAEPIAGSD